MGLESGSVDSRAVTGVENLSLAFWTNALNQKPFKPALLSLQKPTLLSKAQNTCQLYCKELPRSLEQQLQEHR